MPIRDLASHPEFYVKVGDLAEYWAVSRQQIYKQIESGSLEALRLGPRLYRVRTSAALEFERSAGAFTAASSANPQLRLASRLPSRIGVQRVSDSVQSGKPNGATVKVNKK